MPLVVSGQSHGACRINLTLSAWEVFRLRMRNRSLARIAYILGCKKQSVAGVLEQAINKNPIMASWRPGGRNTARGASVKRSVGNRVYKKDRAVKVVQRRSQGRFYILKSYIRGSGRWARRSTT
jgi:hypothetical protein